MKQKYEANREEKIKHMKLEHDKNSEKEHLLHARQFPFKVRTKIHVNKQGFVKANNKAYSSK